MSLINWHNSSNSLESLTDKDDREFALKLKQFELERLKTILATLGLGAIAIAAVSLFFVYKESKLTEQFAKAVEQLGHPDIAVRIGSIYTLERLAEDAPQYHWTVMEMLTAYVRERSPLPEKTELARLREAEGLDPPSPIPRHSEVTEDVRAALNVFKGRDASRDKNYLDLSDVNLTTVQFAEANLNNISFFASDLSRANLRNANLTEANLSRAILSWTNLKNTNLTKADLSDANLRSAQNVTDTQLQSAKLCKTQLPKSSKLNPDRDCKELK